MNIATTPQLATTDLPPILEQFISLYQVLDKRNIQRLKEIYSPEITFIDPAHRLHGLANVETYFANLYENAQSVSFDIASVEHGENKAWVRWTMIFQHPRLNANKPVHVHGCTYLTYDKFITQHQDYFDLGAMIYENIPLLGKVIRWLKNRLNQ